MSQCGGLAFAGHDPTLLIKPEAQIWVKQGRRLNILHSKLYEFISEVSNDLVCINLSL